MTKQPNLTHLTRWSDHLTRVPADTASHVSMYKQAMTFIQGQRWCKQVEDVYVGLIHPGIVAVFLFRVEPSRPEVDEWMWVVVGDLPPAYVASEDCLTPGSALDGYIGEMDDWVRAVEEGRPIDEVIPVNAPPTSEFAQRLKARLDFLHERILPLHDSHE